LKDKIKGKKDGKIVDKDGRPVTTKDGKPVDQVSDDGEKPQGSEQLDGDKLDSTPDDKAGLKPDDTAGEEAKPNQQDHVDGQGQKDARPIATKPETRKSQITTREKKSSQTDEMDGVMMMARVTKMMMMVKDMKMRNLLMAKPMLSLVTRISRFRPDHPTRLITSLATRPAASLVTTLVKDMRPARETTNLWSKQSQDRAQRMSQVVGIAVLSLTKKVPTSLITRLAQRSTGRTIIQKP